MIAIINKDQTEKQYRPRWISQSVTRTRKFSDTGYYLCHTYCELNRVVLLYTELFC